MEKKFEEIKKFAEATLGEVPEVINLLNMFDEDAAVEQFNENGILYLGRRNVPRKILALIALSVALANGPKESAAVHFKLARKFGASKQEIIDTFRVAKMALMSSTLDFASPILDMGKEELLSDDPSASALLDRVKREAGIIPERLSLTASVSPKLLQEHLRERNELLNAKALERKYVFAIAYAVSVSIHDLLCQKVYLDQFIRNDGTKDELEDIVATVRFVVGNRAFVNGLDILRQMRDSEKA